MKRCVLALIISMIPAAFVPADAGEGLYAFSRAISWEKLELEATVSVNVAKAGLKLPSGRLEAEGLCEAAFPRLVDDTLLDLPVDSSTTIRNLVDAGTIHQREVSRLATGAQRRSAALSEDFSRFETGYRINLKELFPALVVHRHRTEPARPLDPVESRPYTGIVIYVNEELPVHGTHSAQRAALCLFPKVWDSGMEIVYEKNMVDPAIARERGIVRYTDNGDEPDLAALVGAHPLSVLAEGLFGSRPTDPVISREDALQILSNDDNRKLLAEGRVVLVVPREVLHSFGK